MTYQEVWNRSEDGSFKQRLAVALAKYSKEVFAEDIIVGNHAERIKLAMLVYKSPYLYATQLAVSASIALEAYEELADAHFDTLVAQFWTTIACSLP